MKDVKKGGGLRYLTALCLTLAIFVGSSAFVLAAPERNSLTGEIVVSGLGENGDKPYVHVNGERAVSGRTFFSASVIETSEFTSADINLGRLGRIGLAPNSILSLSFTENTISGKLSTGKIQVFSAKGVAVNIETPDNAVFNDKELIGNFTIDLQSGTSQATAESGSIRFNDGREVGQVQTTTATRSRVFLPLAILAGAVAVAVIYVAANGNDDNVVSPRR